MERPIIFSGEMVRAILEGRKTQTRRVMIPQPPHHTWSHYKSDKFNFLSEGGQYIKCPYGQPGDRLWVRETWKPGAWLEDDGLIAIDYKASPEITNTSWMQIPDDEDGEKFNNFWLSICDELHKSGIEPDCDGEYYWEHGKSPLKWRPSIFMPKWASRIALEIVNVRVERLQDISEEDAIAEGCIGLRCEHTYSEYGCTDCLNTGWIEPPSLDFMNLWNLINGKKYPWESNAWVWVIEFKRIDN